MTEGMGTRELAELGDRIDRARAAERAEAERERLRGRLEAEQRHLDATEQQIRETDDEIADTRAELDRLEGKLRELEQRRNDGLDKHRRLIESRGDLEAGRKLLRGRVEGAEKDLRVAEAREAG